MHFHLAMQIYLKVEEIVYILRKNKNREDYVEVRIEKAPFSVCLRATLKCNAQSLLLALCLLLLRLLHAKHMV